MSGASAPDGLQPERTVLAWRRSALSFTVVGLLVSRAAALNSSPVGVAVSLVATAVALCLVALRRDHVGSVDGRGGVAGEIRVQDGFLPAVVVAVTAVLCLVVIGLAVGVSV